MLPFPAPKAALSDDAQRPIGSSAVRCSCRQARSVPLAHGMEGAQAVLRAISLYLQIIGDRFASLSVAQDHFIFGVFELKTAQHVKS